jgi:hypothetical protein
MRVFGAVTAAFSLLNVIAISINLARHWPITKKSLKDPRVMFSLTSMGGTIGNLVYSTLKAIDPVEYIISDNQFVLAVSWYIFQAFFVWSIGYFGAILGLFITNYTRTFRGYSGSTAGMGKALYVLKHWPFGTALSLCFPIVMAISPSSGEALLEGVVAYAMINVLVMALALFIVSRIFVHLLFTIINERETSSQPPGIQLVYHLMKVVHMNIIFILFILAPIMIPFIFMDFFRRKFIYYSMTLHMVWAQASGLVIFSQMKKSKSSVQPYIGASSSRPSAQQPKARSSLLRPSYQVNVISKINGNTSPT